MRRGHRDPRRLTGGEEWIWYVVAAVTYISLGVWHKWLLNWFIGPAWLVATVVIGPRLVDRIVPGRRGDTDRTGAP